MGVRGLWRLGVVVAVVGTAAGVSHAWTPVDVDTDPLLRMPGSQPGQADLEGANRCGNCHEDTSPNVTIVSDWQGSMMAQSLRDPLFWATMTVAAQDSVWAVGNPNAADLCIRCHTPPGWMGGRSDPTNGSALTGDDFDGVSCDSCHRLVDPFAEETYAGLRDIGSWDEATSLSATELDRTHAADAVELAALSFFDGSPMYDGTNHPVETGWDENGAGQFIYAASNDKRGPFADADPRHSWLYSRYTKSRHFCGTCHDVSNPVLHNLGATGSPLPTEEDPAYSYEHVERTFSEFMLSDFGTGGGAAGSGAFDPSVFSTAQPGNLIATCQDCHMRDRSALGCNKSGVLLRPDESTEHSSSGQPMHDLTGGNVLVPWLLASTVPGSMVYDPVNEMLLNQGAAALTMVLDTGQGLNADALIAGAMRAEQNLTDAASLESVVYDPSTGDLSLRVRNHTGHKLISGYPEGRRMWLNVQLYSGATLVEEVNPYDETVGTLRGIDPVKAPSSPPLGAAESHEDGLVYEMVASSSLTGEDQSFHFALADGRHKDNRIPPRGFRIAEAAQRLATPVMGGVDRPDLFTAAEYAGGYDDVALTVAPGATRVVVTLYYQTTTREYVEFLQNEINGTSTTLSSPTPSGETNAYIAQTDPFFDQLAAWGDTIFDLWDHNKTVPGAAPIVMAQADATVSPGGCASAGSDGLPCDDGDPCTTVDACDAGSCVGTVPVVCDSPGVCDGAGSCNTSTGACEYAPLTGDSCDDGDACTSGDVCNAGACESGTPLACDSPPECHGGGTCDASGSCVYTPLADGTTCATGVCESGVCRAVTTDGGVPSDAGIGPDAGPGDAGVPDAGVPDAGAADAGAADAGAADAGAPTDAGVPTDAGTPADAGAAADGGAEADGGVADAGVATDGGPRRDATPGTDAGPEPDSTDGCGCATPGRSDPPPWWLLLVGGLALWRRRRSY